MEDGGKNHEGTEGAKGGESSSDGQEPSLSKESNAESEEEQQSSREPDVLVEEVDESKHGVFGTSGVVVENDLLLTVGEGA